MDERKARYQVYEEVHNLDTHINDGIEGYKLHSFVHMGYFDYHHHYTVIWELQSPCEGVEP